MASSTHHSLIKSLIQHSSLQSQHGLLCWYQKQQELQNGTMICRHLKCHEEERLHVAYSVFKKCCLLPAVDLKGPNILKCSGRKKVRRRMSVCVICLTLKVPEMQGYHHFPWAAGYFCWTVQGAAWKQLEHLFSLVNLPIQMSDASFEI